MGKRILCFLIASILFFSEGASLGTVMAECEDSILVVDTANTGMIKDAGLAASTVHTYKRPYSMKWYGLDLSKAITLSCNKDQYGF